MDNPYSPPEFKEPSDFSQEPQRTLTFSGWYPFAAGALYGLLCRFAFWGPTKAYADWISAMSLGFVVGAPVAIGAITVYLAEKQSRRSYRYYFFAPWISVGACVGGTAVLLIEGSICIAIMSPLFLLMGSIGGVIMGAICRARNKPVRTLQGFALLPALLAIGEVNQPLPQDQHRLSHTVFIAASPDEVWRNIHSASDIRGSEVDDAWVYRIGVPHPLSGITTETPEGRIRKSRWNHGVAFDEVITDWDENRYVRWTYRFTDDSFPEGSMDDHVRIGGKYFDLQDSSYALKPVEGGTLLTINVGYRISTRFNWYAEPVGDFLLNDFATSILNFYKRRSENHAASAQESAVKISSLQSS